MKVLVNPSSTVAYFLKENKLVSRICQGSIDGGTCVEQSSIIDQWRLHPPIKQRKKHGTMLVLTHQTRIRCNWCLHQKYTVVTPFGSVSVNRKIDDINAVIMISSPIVVLFGRETPFCKFCFWQQQGQQQHWAKNRLEFLMEVRMYFFF